MKLRYIIAAFMLVTTTLSSSAQDWKTYPYQPEGSLISFPKDEGRHSREPIEWWYTIGHVKGAVTGNNYTYMLTYFYTVYPPYQGFRIFNVSNDDTGEFYEETLPVSYVIAAEDSLNLLVNVGFNPLVPKSVEVWKNKLDGNGKSIPFEYLISAKSAKGALNVEYSSVKPPLILGGDGFFYQGAANYTYYYSQTKNLVAGTFTINGFTEPISGTSWIDRQYGTFNPNNPDENYEWFCVQLSNGMDINFWDLFDKHSKVPDDPKYRNISVYYDEDSSYTNTNYKIERLAYNFTTDNIMCYAQKWRLTSPINDIDIVISTNYNNTEVRIPFRFYEGATTVEGTVNGVPVTGVGFAELLHSYKHPHIVVSQPLDDTWDESIPITWALQNPDDGRPLLYDLSYSIDDKNTFLPIAQGLTDTFYVWNSSAVENNDNCWFKIEAYSIDTTLANDSINASAILVSKIATSNLASKYVFIPSLNVFPNPANDRIRVRLENKQAFNSYTIYDVSGKTILSKSLGAQTQIEINTSELESGIYFIQVKAENKTAMSQFIIR